MTRWLTACAVAVLLVGGACVMLVAKRVAHVAPVLLFAHEVAPENDDDAPTEPHMTAGED